ncbi:MAG: hypothetical protein HYW86_04675 [Candidatus Roizmanbacteria bacterium]|nr:MAG: hypothetical protein HYW86_04675 [Candidatus Roizmanbacteria bacterium]
MQTSQVQLKISLSEQLNDLLKGKAQRLGVPVTQLVKHIIIKEVENERFPTFIVSSKTEKKAEKALREIDQSEIVDNVEDYFNNL